LKSVYQDILLTQKPNADRGGPSRRSILLLSLDCPRRADDGQSGDDPRYAKLPANPHFLRIKAQIDGVHAHGSWRAYIMAPRLEVLTLRGLANRGKIRSTDPALNNLVALPNELICQVLAFWFG